MADRQPFQVFTVPAQAGCGGQGDLTSTPLHQFGFGKKRKNVHQGKYENHIELICVCVKCMIDYWSDIMIHTHESSVACVIKLTVECAGYDHRS